MAMVVPIPQEGGNKLLLLIILNKKGVERLEVADPTVIASQEVASIAELTRKGSACTHIHDVDIMIVYEEDDMEFLAWAMMPENRTSAALLERVTRNVTDTEDHEDHITKLVETWLVPGAKGPESGAVN